MFKPKLHKLIADELVFITEDFEPSNYEVVDDIPGDYIITRLFRNEYSHFKKLKKETKIKILELMNHHLLMSSLIGGLERKDFELDKDFPTSDDYRNRISNMLSYHMSEIILSEQSLLSDQKRDFERLSEILDRQTGRTTRFARKYTNTLLETGSTGPLIDHIEYEDHMVRYSKSTFNEMSRYLARSVMSNIESSGLDIKDFDVSKVTNDNIHYQVKRKS